MGGSGGAERPQEKIRKIKNQIISWLQKSGNPKRFGSMSPNQVAHKATQLLERIVEAETPPIITISNEIQKTTEV